MVSRRARVRGYTWGMGDPVLEAIERLATEPSNWDSYGASAVSPVAIARARRCVEDAQWRLAPHFVAPAVGPDVDGGVELIWSSPRGRVHVHVGTGERFRVLIMRGERLDGPAQMKTPADLIDLLKTHFQR